MQQRDKRTTVKNTSVQLSKDNTTTQYSVLNISRGGICIEANENAFELNERVQLDIKIDSQSIHKAKARICYYTKLNPNDTSSYGLSFLDKFIDTQILRNIN